MPPAGGSDCACCCGSGCLASSLIGGGLAALAWIALPFAVVAAAVVAIVYMISNTRRGPR